jgi:hypothetical protein
MRIPVNILGIPALASITPVAAIEPVFNTRSLDERFCTLFKDSYPAYKTKWHQQENALSQCHSSNLPASSGGDRNAPTKHSPFCSVNSH